MKAADALKAAMRGGDVVNQNLTIDEEVGFLLLADAIGCLKYLRDAKSGAK